MPRQKPQYEDVRKLIYFKAKQFYMRFGGEFEEIVGQALLIYIQASLKFKFRHGIAFSAYISRQIWKGLIDYHKKLWLRPQPYLEDMITQKIISIPSYSDRAIWFRVDLNDSITRDARFIVKIVLDPDSELRNILLRTKGKHKKKGHRVERRALREYLIKKRNWTEGKVDSAFMKLQKALRP